MRTHPHCFAYSRLPCLASCIIAIFALLLSSHTWSQDQAETSIRQLFKDDVAAIAFDTTMGLYVVDLRDGSTAFFNQAATHFVWGDAYRITEQGVVNISEAKRQQQRLATLQNIPEHQTVNFQPKGASRGDIYVFTDIDCGYCRTLHREIDVYTSHGITVHYLAYPRAGLDSRSFNKAESVWCAENQQDAMTKAKRGENVTSPVCNNPVAEHYNLGNQLGVRGTPFIVLDNGHTIPGYRPAHNIIALFDTNE